MTMPDEFENKVTLYKTSLDDGDVTCLIEPCIPHKKQEYVKAPEPIEGLGDAIEYYDFMDDGSNDMHKVLLKAAKAFHALTGEK